MKIGSFKMSGADYTVELDNKLCKNCNAKFMNSIQKIIVSDEYEGVKLNYDIIENNIVSCFVEMITVFEMEYRKLLGDEKYIQPFSSMLYQAMSTLTSKEGSWDGDVKIGGSNYMIVVNNTLGIDDGFHGRCDGVTKIIYLCTGNNEVEYNTQYIERVIWHEIIHAINNEIGYCNTKYNSEKFVNTLANHVYQFVNTLELKFPEE